MILLLLLIGQAASTVPHGACFNVTEDAALMASKSIPAQIGHQHVAIPFDMFTDFFFQANLWPTWNPLFSNISTTQFDLCGPLDASYSNPPNCTFPTSFTQPHHIVQMLVLNHEAAFAWQFELIDDDGNMFVFGRHTYTMEEWDDGTLVSSWEKAAGSQVDSCQLGWSVALQESLLDGFSGVVCLERVYLETGKLDPDYVAQVCQNFKP